MWTYIRISELSWTKQTDQRVTAPGICTNNDACGLRQPSNVFRRLHKVPPRDSSFWVLSHKDTTMLRQREHCLTYKNGWLLNLGLANDYRDRICTRYYESVAQEFEVGYVGICGHLIVGEIINRTYQ